MLALAVASKLPVLAQREYCACNLTGVQEPARVAIARTPLASNRGAAQRAVSRRLSCSVNTWAACTRALRTETTFNDPTDVQPTKALAT
jgi:hypothetical protein